MGTATRPSLGLAWTTATADSDQGLLPLGSGPQIGPGAVETWVRPGHVEPWVRTGANTTRTMSADDQAPGGELLAPGARSDEDLMLAFRDGEAAAFEELVARHKRGLYNYLLRSVHTQSRAEELLQEVFLRVVRAKDRYQRTARFTTWVYTIARNLCVDESRRQKFRRTVPLEAKRRGRDHDSDGATVLDVTPAAQVGTDLASETASIRERVAAAIQNLPDDQREVFIMRQFGGLSFKQIGEAVGAPENTVKSRMRYALDKLRGDLRDIDPRDQDPRDQNPRDQNPREQAPREQAPRARDLDQAPRRATKASASG
jgi:RNA polymerase sigma-70 factor, ECF subfamily